MLLTDWLPSGLLLILFYLADAVTTWYGMSRLNLKEGIPWERWMIRRLGHFWNTVIVIGLLLVLVLTVWRELPGFLRLAAVALALLAPAHNIISIIYNLGKRRSCTDGR